MRTYFDSGATLSYEFRKEQLLALRKAIKTFEPKIYKALWSDLHKGEAEAYTTEIGFIYAEIDHTLAHLKEWMHPNKRSTPLFLFPSSSKIYYRPMGVVLIISPWNYPFQLAIAPLIGAIAAGNCAVIKPSEDTPHTSAVVAELIASAFAKNYIDVVQGIGKEVVPALMEKYEFNHIFFTGSPAVGSIIAVEAAKKLISTTLELGGKSPGIIDASANLKVAARRLTWAKYTNAGQTCIAPDYLLVHRSVRDEFVKELKAVITEFYGIDPKQSKDYGRMVNERRYDTVSAYLNDGEVIFGGASDRSEKYIAPTLLTDAALDSAVMTEEIFGPIWPIVLWDTGDDLLKMVRMNRYPLACYYFGSDKNNERLVLDQMEFGGGCINDALVQFGNPDLPFGGVQGSGSGQYHGKDSFLCFSHAKSVMKTVTWIDPNVKYPPYDSFKIKVLKWFLG